MDDSSLRSRRTRLSQRPDSSSSSRTNRMTSAGSDYSSATTLPTQRSHQSANAPSSLLQERLDVKKAENCRSLSTNSGYTSREVQSSPLRPTSEQSRRLSTSGRDTPTAKMGVGMGVKQMEESFNKLEKQNFNLKLELFHRRQRQDKMELELDAARKQLADQAELQEINDQLLAELERRDQAVDEAVDQIWKLETKVDMLMQDREDVKTFERQTSAQYDADYFVDKELDIPSSPPMIPDFAAARREARSKVIARMPSFLSEQSEGVEALRSLYLPSNTSYSDTTLPKLMEERSDGINSPLSVLSESSFVSIYGQRRSPPQEDDANMTLPRPQPSAVEKWIDGRPIQDDTPTQRRSASAESGRSRNQYQSLNYIAGSPMKRLAKLQTNIQKNIHDAQHMRGQEMMRNPIEPRQMTDNGRRIVMDQGKLDSKLPPTPDTVGTNTLRRLSKSRETLLRDDQKKEDVSRDTSVYSDRTNTFQSTIPERPQSAADTLNSYRAGQGWDCDIQDDLTETASASSTTSTFDYQTTLHVPNQPKRVQTPNLFTYDEEVDPREWGRNMMFDGELSATLPARHQDFTARRHERLRRSSLADTRTGSSGTPTNSKSIREPSSTPESRRLSGPVPPPDRRSSLAAITRLRKPAPSPGSSIVSTLACPAAVKDSKLARLGGRLFGRPDSNPSPTPPLHADAREREDGARAATSLGGEFANHAAFGEELDSSRATPPPIQRVRGAFRPVSEQGFRRGEFGAGCGGDGVGDENEVDEKVTRKRNGSLEPGKVLLREEDVGSKLGGGRKWFGLGRVGSLRKG